ncbi:hypothetical protein KM043_009259 [Ampulex compressa]|nr:hypothetical protein KM043_009259 [Ampulex compressa]
MAAETSSRPDEEGPVTSRARCVRLTSRPSWPLEGGRPPGGLPITRRGIGYSDTPAVRHPIIHLHGPGHETVGPRGRRPCLPHCVSSNANLKFFICICVIGFVEEGI